jgi:hypothetical protein
MLNGLEKHLPESVRRWTVQGGSSFLNTEPLNTRITRGVETMINVDSKLKRILNIFGWALGESFMKAKRDVTISNLRQTPVSFLRFEVR